MITALIGSILGLVWFLNLGEKACGRHGSELKARDAKQLGPPAISIKESQYFDGPDKQWSSFFIDIGNSTTGISQRIRLLPSTYFSWIIAISSGGCPQGSPTGCNDSRGEIYSPPKSLPLLGSVNMSHPTGLPETTIVGQMHSDDVSFSDSLNNVHSMSQSILSINQVDYWVGLLPLSPYNNSVAFSTQSPSLLHALKDQDQIPSLSWGYTAGSKNKKISVFGSLTLGGYDSSRFINTTFVNGSLTGDPSQDFKVALVSIIAHTPDGKHEPSLLTDQSLPALVDSTLPYIDLPQSIYDVFEQQLNVTWNAAAGLYLLSDDDYERLNNSFSNITFVVQPISTSGDGAKVQFVIPISSLLIKVSLAEINLTVDGESWYIPFRRAAADGISILGRAFLQEAYLIADYERNKFSLSPVFWPDSLVYEPSYHTIQPPSSSKKGGGLSKGALAGIIVGGIIGGLILACIVLHWYRHRQRTRRRLPSKSAPPSYVGAHTSEASIAGGRSRASSRIASLFPFRNPWSGNERGYEPPQDPGYVMPPEGEHKGPLGNELDAHQTGVYEMYQPKRVIPEVEGDTSYSNGGLAPGAVGDNARTSSSSIDPHTRVEGDDTAKPVNVFEMEANSLDPGSQGPSPMPTPSLPSPSSAEAAERHVLAENQRQIRPDTGDRRTSGQSTESVPSPYPTNERRVSDRSLMSLSVFSDAGTGTLGSIFADHPFSTPSGIGGSEAASNASTGGNETQEGVNGGNSGNDGDGAPRSVVAPEAEVSGKQPAQPQAQQPQTRRPSASVLSRSLSSRSRSGSEGPPVNLGAITEDHEREGAMWMKL